MFVIWERIYAHPVYLNCYISEIVYAKGQKRSPAGDTLGIKSFHYRVIYGFYQTTRFH